LKTTTDMAYMARDSAGRCVAVAIEDLGPNRRELAKDVAEWIRRGCTVDRVPAEQATAALQQAIEESIARNCERCLHHIPSNHLAQCRRGGWGSDAPGEPFRLLSTKHNRSTRGRCGPTAALFIAIPTGDRKP
jgi:hypothetical protein